MNPTQVPSHTCYVYTYCDTLTSKNKLKKFIILNFLIKKFSSNQEHINLVVINSSKRQKNIMLSSPFHFKTVKTHLYIPTYLYQINIKPCNFSNENILMSLSKFALIGILIKRKTINYRKYML